MFVKDLVAELRSRDLPVILFGLTLAIVVSGPFGSYGSLDFWQRLAFWFPVLIVGILGFLAFRILVLYRFPAHRRGLGAVVAAGIYAVLTAPLFGILFRLTFGPYFGTLAGWGEIATLIYLVTLGFCFLRHPSAPGALASDLDASRTVALTHSAPAQPISAKDPESRLLERLNPDLRGEITALQVRDHYVEVSTLKGRSNLLMRLSDAIAELPPERGAQVHRSFWVAWAAINAVEWQGARVFLRLTCGMQVPVSRANLPKLEQRGLI